MKTDMTAPCPQCPFLTTCQKGWLGRSRAQEIAGALLADKSLACHKTVDYSGDDGRGHGPGGDDEQHCAGAMLFLEKQGRANQWMRWMERLGFYDARKLDMEAPVFGSAREFVRHHAARQNAIGKLQRRKRTP